jgi:cytoplasmic iron level regulating protein YaaA (DUF328/UPF0246 family)
MGKANFPLVSSQRFVILLPPSEGKAAGGTKGTKWNHRSGAFGTSLAAERTSIVDALRRAKGGDAALLGVKGDHLARAKKANVALRGAPTLPAWQRYTGVVWDHLDIASLTTTEKSRALSSIVVVSGLLGLVQADDPIPDYRLKMGARLAPFGNLATWWREPISSTLAQKFAKHVVIDLLPLEHRKALTIEDDTFAEYLRVGLFERGGKAGGHDAKAAKGRLARHLILNATKGASAALKSFRDPQYVVRVER